MTLAVRLPDLFPPLAVLALAAQAETEGGAFVVGDVFGYTRTQRANRMRLRTADGWTWATAPLAGATLGQRLDTVALAPTLPWARRMTRTLQHAYGQAPFFAHYGPDVAAILAAPHASAASLALASTAWLFARFSLPAPIAASALVSETAGGDAEDAAPLTLADLVDRSGATQLVALPDTAERDARTRPTNVLPFVERPRRQMFDGFVPGLSALDALFLYGPDVRQWLG